MAPAFYLEAVPLPGSPTLATSLGRAILAGIDGAGIQGRLATDAVALQF